MFYRKIPVTIEAIQYTGENREEISEFCGKDIIFTDVNGHREAIIRTLEGDMHASVGDYIIKGIKGEFYPCKPDVFEKTYEEV